MATRTAQKRLTKEYKAILESPTPYIETHPSESNILEWYYLITGPPDTPYEGGQYMGVLVFPPDYPYKPPSIRMVTPSGRFQPNARLCLSISDYHPKTWNPAWSVSTILVGLLSFMVGDEFTAGSVVTSDANKRAYAKKSIAWNLQDGKFQEHFPQLAEELRKNSSEAAKTPSVPDLVKAIETSPRLAETEAVSARAAAARTSPSSPPVGARSWARILVTATLFVVAGAVWAGYRR